MVKKCLIAIAVVALLATTVQASAPAIKHDGTWPWTKMYDELPICTFPVKLAVGHYVQIENCNDMVLKLEQVDCTADIMGPKGVDDFPCYYGCVDFRARANFPAVFGASFDGSAGDVDIITEKSFSWPNGNTLVNGIGADWEDLKLCMIAWQVNLWSSGTPSGDIKVGEITLLVKPPDESGP